MFEEMEKTRATCRKGVLLLWVAMLVRTEVESFDTVPYNAEIEKTLDLLTNRLYKEKYIFVRELLSNARDALEKMRTEMTVNVDDYSAEEREALSIRVWTDPEAWELVIEDNGIGMTREEMARNLGVIALSGTQKFREQSEKKGGKMIGKFGVGFYSAFLGAEQVQVESRSFRAGAEQVAWVSEGKKDFRIGVDPESAEIKRGTRVRLRLKKDEADYDRILDADFLEGIVEKYSQFSSTKIYMYKQKTREVEVPMTEEEVEAAKREREQKKEEEDEDEEDGEEEKEEEDWEEEKGKEKEEEERFVKKVEEKYAEWDLVDIEVPIWEKNPETLEEEEFESFYRTMVGDKQAKYMDRLLFRTEGTVEFDTVLFIPERADSDSSFLTSDESDIRIYLQNVIISDRFKKVLPKYLSFMKGAVNASELDINIDRQTFQHNKELAVIGKRLKKKAFEMIRNLKQDELGEDDELEGKGGSKGKYDKFLDSFGHFLKYGLIEGSPDGEKILDLLKFHSSKVGETEMTGLEEYVERAHEDQKEIYFLSGYSVREMMADAVMEKPLDLGIEVLLLVSPLDESALQHQEYKKMRFRNISKENVDFSFASEEEKLSEDEKEEFKVLFDYLQENVKSKKVVRVVPTNRLKNSPMVLVSAEFAMSSHMNKVMNAHNFSGKKAKMDFMNFKVLEVNIRHPTVLKLKEMVYINKKDKTLKKYTRLLLDAVMFASGEELHKKRRFCNYVIRSLDEKLDELELEELPEESPADGEEEKAEAEEDVNEL